jgi:hypothetical protein
MTTTDRPDVTARVLLRRMIREWLDMDTNDPFDEEMAATPSGQELLRRADATRATDAEVAGLRAAVADVLLHEGCYPCAGMSDALERLAPLAAQPAAPEAETWAAHVFQPGASAPDKCLWTNGRWSACKAPADARCHVPVRQPAAPEAEPERVAVHRYSPSWMHMGRCSVCGHVDDSPLHDFTPTPR